MVDPEKLKQCYYDVHKSKKLSLLVHLLKEDTSGLAMVFCNTRRNTDFVTKNLRANKLDAISIHGGLTQNKRTKTIELFDKGKAGILVCTDVAARGLHIENISHIYNYDIPRDPTDYIHRIGRTARAGETGLVVNILTEVDYNNFSRISSEHREFIVRKFDTPELPRIIIKKSEDSGRPRFGSHSRGGYGGSGHGRAPRGRSFGHSRERGGNRSPRHTTERAPRGHTFRDSARESVGRNY